MAVSAPPVTTPFRSRIRPWIDLQELPKHLANLLPFLLGTAVAYWHAGTIDWTVFAVALLALFLLTDGLLRSAILIAQGGWREPQRLEAGAVAGFIGTLLIPLALTVAFAGAALLR